MSNFIFAGQTLFRGGTWMQAGAAGTGGLNLPISSPLDVGVVDSRSYMPIVLVRAVCRAWWRHVDRRRLIIGRRYMFAAERLCLLAD